MAIPYVTGAAHIYVGVGAGFSAVYLGTAQHKPKIRIKRNWSPVMNDIGGDEPFDWSAQSKSALVSVILTRWNEPVYAALANEPNPFRNINLDGVDLDGDIGTLMFTENVARPLWVLYPYGAGGLAPKIAMAQGLMRSGYCFLRTFMLGPDDLEPGTRPYQITLNFYCMRNYTVLDRQFQLYHNNMAGLPIPS